MTGMRRSLQVGFLILTLAAVFLAQANAEQWCPFGAVEALYTYASEGNMICSLGVSNLYIFGGVLLSALLLRRAFCGYVCPLGAISDGLRALAARVGLPAVPISDSVDRALALLKYLTLVLILVVTWQAGELFFRGYCPAYALLSRHGADITLWAYVIAGGMAIASLVITMPFCRWFCPLAAVLNPWARFGLMRVQRDVGACRECGRCTAICPMAIPVDRVKQVTASRCLSCLRCLEACPSRPAGALSWGLPGQAGQGRPGVIIPAVLFLCLGAAVAAAYLVPWPSFIKSRGTPPGDTAEVRLRIQGLTCRGRANLLVGFLERDDWYGIPGPAAGVPGYFKFEAWPDPVIAEVRIRFDPRLTNEETIKRAIIEPFYDAAKDQLWTSPFMIEGYDPLDLDRDESAESKSG